jgi:7,8-dihydropterin-6-yl-methyl-4-(beta-D-ribofuranosyl)aminobenzene 5'-phosphate synthase
MGRTPFSASWQRGKASLAVVALLVAAAALTAASPGDEQPAARPNGQHDIVLTILYDNNPYDTRLCTANGFTCLIQGLEKTILFDTGGSSVILASNMRQLGLDPKDVDIVFISHDDGDHVGGLDGFLMLNSNVDVFPPEFVAPEFKSTVALSGARMVGAGKAGRICESAYSTGGAQHYRQEQSLVIDTPAGLVLMTGCSHGGIVNILQNTKAQFGRDVYMVVGGFHLQSVKDPQVEAVVEQFKAEGVGAVIPCHCSGGKARELFEKSFGDGYTAGGVGRRIVIAGPREGTAGGPAKPGA